MSKRDYHLDLVKAKPAALAGYFDSALFAEWITGLDDEALFEAERAFQAALTKTASYRFGRAAAKNYRLSQAALTAGTGGGKSAGLRGV